jgi:NDP-sugar pyrophosphorylase family protein
MRTFILAGGLGTRLLDKVSDAPKAMASVAGKPFLAWQIKLLKAQGFNDIVMCLGYRSQQIIDHFGDGSNYGVNIGYSVENEPLGTAGALMNASSLIDGTFMLLNGDTFFDMDFQGLCEFHEAKEAEMTLSLTMVDDVSRYGSVSTDVNNRVSKFNEKESDTTCFGYINAGVYIFEPSVLELIPPQKAVSLENEVIPSIISKDKVYGFISDGFFIDIGTPESYDAAQRFFKRYL